LAAGAECGWLSADAARHLTETYALCWSLQIGSRLIAESTVTPDTAQGAAADFLCRITGVDSMSALRDRLDAHSTKAARMINAALPDPETDT